MMDESECTSTVHPDDIDMAAKPQHCTSSNDSLSSDGSHDESTCSTVVIDSADSDATPSPFLLGGLQFIKRTEIQDVHPIGSDRQCESGDIFCAESDNSQSTNCSESIFDPTKRLTKLVINESKAEHINNQQLVNDAVNNSPVISVLSSSDHQHQSSSFEIIRRDGRDCQTNNEDSPLTSYSLKEITRVDPTFYHDNALSPDLLLGQDSGHSGHVSRRIDVCGKSSGNDGDGMKGIPSHHCSSDIATDPVKCTDTIVNQEHDQEYERSTDETAIDSFDHQTVPSPEKMRKVSAGSGRVRCSLSDSLEDVTQVDGSACMFSDSSPVKSQSDHVLHPQEHTLGRDADCSEEDIGRNEQHYVGPNLIAKSYQISGGGDDMTRQITSFSITESCRSNLQCQQEAIIQPFDKVNASSSGTSHKDHHDHEAGLEEDLTCNESISSLDIERKYMRNIEGADVVAVTKPKPRPNRMPTVSKPKSDVSRETSRGDDGPGCSGTRIINSIDVPNVAGGRGRPCKKFPKKGKQQKRSLQAVKKRAKSSHINQSLDQPVTRSQRQNAGIHRSDILIHERVLGLQEKLMNVKSSHNKLTQALSKPKKVIKDAAKVGQQLLTIQTNLRQIAADIKEVKTDLERSLFDLRFVHSQRKRKEYVQEELDSILEVQQSLWSQLKVHREIASRLQEIIRKHTKEMKENRRKQAKQSTEKIMGSRQSPRLTPSSDESSENSCAHGSDRVTGNTAKESLAAEKQNALLQQLLGTLGECKGNLLIKFMSVLQGKGPDPDNAVVDLDNSSQADSSSRVQGKDRTKNVNHACSSRDPDIATDDTDAKKLGEKGDAGARKIMKDASELSGKSFSFSQNDEMGLSSKLNPGRDSSEKETAVDDDCSSSGDGGAAEFLSSSDDEMSVVPESFQKLSESPNRIVLEAKAADGISGQLAPSWQAVPAVAHVDEGANGATSAVQSSVPISSSSSTSATDLASLTSIQKTVQASVSQFSNNNSSGQKIASFHTPWKVLVSNTQTDIPRIDNTRLQQVPSDCSIKSAAPSDKPLGAYSNINTEEIGTSLSVKTHFRFIPKTTSSQNSQTFIGSYPQAPTPVITRLSSHQTEKTRPYLVQKITLKAGPLLQNTTRSVSVMPKSYLQDDNRRTKLSDRANSGTGSPALDSIDGVRCQKAGAISYGESRASANGSTLSCDGRSMVMNTDPSICVSGPPRDARYQPDHVPGIPDMKLFKKVHLINENELMPYTEILPKEMWSTDDISMVDMPQEFFEEIDSW